MVRLTADVIEYAPQYFNPLHEREIDLRGEPAGRWRSAARRERRARRAGSCGRAVACVRARVCACVCVYASATRAVLLQRRQRSACGRLVRTRAALSERDVVLLTRAQRRRRRAQTTG